MNVISEFGDKVKVSSNAVIYEGVILEEDVVVHDFTVIYPNTIIRKGTEVFESCVLGRPPVAPKKVLSRKLKEDYSGLVIGENCIINPGAVIYAGSALGNSTLVGENSSIREECTIGNNCIISRNVSINYNTTIGNNTKIMDNAHITGNMNIGNNVFISTQIASSNDNTMGREEYEMKHVKGAIIEDYATIGAAANLLPNVRIGRNAVVGAGSVVTKDVNANEVVMGVPAKFVKKVEVER